MTWRPIADARAPEKKALRIMLWLAPCSTYPKGIAVFGRWVASGFWTYDIANAMGIEWIKKNQPTHFQPEPEGPTP